MWRKAIVQPPLWLTASAKVMVSSVRILEVDTRLKSGKIEEALKAFVNDKTNWRKMLKNEVDKVDLVATKNQLLPEVSNMMG
jgi:hypothetical protein